MDTINELVKLKSLKDSGIITESEFNDLKNKLLNNQNVETEPEIVLNTELTSEQGQSHSYFEESMSSSRNKIADKGNPNIFRKIGIYIGFLVLLFGVMIIWENVTKGKSSTWEMITGGKSKKENIDNNSTVSDSGGNILCIYASTINEVKKCLAGVWIENTRDQIWKKIEFTANGTYKLWEAYPADGKWGSTPESGKYAIEEKRFSDTGEKYVCVRLLNTGMGDYEYNLVFDGSTSTFNFGSKHIGIIRKGDSNPWN